MRERKFSTSIQLSGSQLNILDKIVEFEGGKVSNSEVLRKAFDYYSKKVFPQFVKKIEVIRRGE